jgi:hypothetical protein
VAEGFALGFGQRDAEIQHVGHPALGTTLMRNLLHNPLRPSTSHHLFVVRAEG